MALAAVIGGYALVAASVTAASGGASPLSGSPVTVSPSAIVGAAAGAERTSGCGRPPVPGPTTGGTGDVVQSTVVDGIIRSYRLAVPLRYRPTRPAPLILLFHGSGSNALQTSVYTQMPARAARLGYLVATPDGIDGQWQLSVPDAHTADLDFASALIASLSSRYCVDRTRLYAAGISLGSEFSVVVACAVPHRIAAIGLVAAEFPLRPCAGPIPVLAFHGTADPLVPYANGGTGRSIPGVPLAGAVQNLAGWADLDRCRHGPDVGRVAIDVVRRRWSECGRGSDVVLYTVLGGGHTWPGSPVALPVAIFGPTTEHVDATGLMLAFFARHDARQ